MVVRRPPEANCAVRQTALALNLFSEEAPQECREEGLEQEWSQEQLVPPGANLTCASSFPCPRLFALSYSS